MPLVSASVRTTMLDDAGDLSAPPGSSPWAVAVRLKILVFLKDTASSAEHLHDWIALMRHHQGYCQLCDAQGHPFSTYEAFCLAPHPYGLGYDPAAIDRIITERRSVQAQAKTATPLAAHRRPTNEEAYNKPDDKRFKGYGTSAEYLVRRIARDRPDILARMQAGEFRSVRQAAKAAGILREKTPLEYLTQYWRKATPEEQHVFLVRVVGGTS